MSVLKRIDELSGNPKVRRSWFTLACAFFLIIIVIPSIFVVTKILTEWDLVNNILSDASTMDIIMGAVWNSFSIAFIVTVIDILVGLPMAWIMVRREFRGKNVLDTLMDLPLAFPTAVLGLSVVVFWAVPPEGITVPGLGLGITPYMLVVLLHIIFTYPYMVRSLSAILEQIEPNYETAAMTLGASRWTAVRTITLPLFRAGLATGFILCFARSLSETGGTNIALLLMGAITDDGGTFFTGPTFIAWMKTAFGGATSPEAMGAMILISVIMIVFALILLVVVRKVMMGFRIPIKKVWPDIGRKVSRGLLPKAKDVLAMAFLLFVVLIPSFYIFAFLTQPTGDIDFGGLLSATGTSFLVAGVAVAVDIVFGMPVAIYIARNKGNRLADVLDELVNVPLIIPTTALGFSLALFWGSFGFSDSVALMLVVLGHISFTYPLVVRNLVGAIEEVDPSYEEIAITLGAKPFQAFRKILFPIIKSSVLAGGILAFTRSLGETGATVAISDSVNTIPIYITNLVKAGMAGEYTMFAEAAMCSIVLIAICFVLMMVIRAMSQGGDRDA
ncbi:MAG: iron ABC transporter permease [Candidatus Methanomethylophilaceae archaeon]|nr:iron ABC transporter permease [Candidatus Methanomethylophilaceae archaeon]